MSSSSQRPASTPEDKRQHRKERYKLLLDEGSLIGENAETADALRTMRSVQMILEQSNSIVSDGNVRDRIENTSEVVMDAQVMKMSHELLGTAIHTMDGAEFDDEQFVLAVLAFVRPDGGESAAAAADTSATDSPAPQWQRLVELAAPLCRTFRWSQCMLGTIDADDSTLVAVASQQRQRQQRRSNTQTQSQLVQVQPVAVAALRAEEKPAQVLNLILKQLRQIFDQNGNVAIPYYQAVVDPLNFMHTVDNCFQVAFLFRDGHLMLGVNNDGGEAEPMIGPVLDGHKEEECFGHMHQMVSSMSPRLWRVSLLDGREWGMNSN